MGDPPRPLPKDTGHPCTRRARSPSPFELAPPDSARILAHLCSIFAPIFARTVRGVGENVLGQWRCRARQGGSAGSCSHTVRARGAKLGTNFVLYTPNI
jgi:hypothetical protein